MQLEGVATENARKMDFFAHLHIFFKYVFEKNNNLIILSGNSLYIVGEGTTNLKREIAQKNDPATLKLKMGNGTLHPPPPPSTHTLTSSGSIVIQK